MLILIKIYIIKLLKALYNNAFNTSHKTKKLLCQGIEIL